MDNTLSENDGRAAGDVGANIDAGTDFDEAVIVALGCNDKGVWGSAQEVLEAALAGFGSEGIDIVARSSWWSSRAWPDPADPPFLNGVVIVKTALEPRALMAALERIEEAFGRVRTFQNAPRTLDLDLIAYGREEGDHAGLVLPHPRAAVRKFVMGPLAEIAPAWRHPVTGLSSEALADEATVGLDASPLVLEP